MKKHLWQYLRIIESRLAFIPIDLGVTLHLEGANPWTPDLWIDFLNADPKKPLSVWPIYKKFARAMEDLRDGMDEAGIRNYLQIRDMKLLSRAEFLTNYESLRGDAEKLHHGIKQAVVGNKADMVKALGKIAAVDHEEARRLILNGAEIPPWGTAVTVRNLAAAIHSIDDVDISVGVSGAGRDNFWLSNILSGLFLSYTAGRVGRLCAAPDCDKFFIPSPHTPGQKYHSTRCQNRTFMRQARSASKEVSNHDGGHP